MQEKQKAERISSIPFVILTTFTVTSPIAIYITKELKKVKDESPYGNEYLYTSDNGLDKE